MNLYVYRQPASSVPKWKARNVTHGFCYEPLNATMPQWEAAWVAAGCRVIREPGATVAADAADASADWILYGTDEIDNVIVATRDAGKPVEPVYQGLEAFGKQYAGKKLTACNLGMEQLRWTQPNGQPKVDYPRILAAVNRITCDYYPIQRGLPINDYGMLIDKLMAMPNGNRVVAAFIEASNQRLNPTYYPHCRAPTPDEFDAEIKLVTDRGLTVGLFPQQIGEDGSGFLYDAMPANLLPVLAKWFPALPPLAGKTAIIDGFAYKLTPP